MPIDFQIPISQQTLTAVSKLDQLRGRWSSAQALPGARLERIEEATRVQSIAASCRLSGVRVSDMEVAGLLRGESLVVRDAKEVLGYASGMRYALPRGGPMLRAEDLCSLHAVVASSPPREGPSPWRQAPHQREAFDSAGKATGRVFSTLPPRMIEQKIDDLLTWLEFELRLAERHPVLVISTFVLGFLAASPFEGCNARLARLLLGQLLRRAGYDYIPYASVESQIESLRDVYHEAFDAAQDRLWSGEANIEPWIDFVVEVLDRHRERVENKLELEREAVNYPPLQQTILETVQEHGTVGAGLLLKATGANRNTLKDNLRKLVHRGVLERIGERRGARYRLSTLDRAAVRPPGGPGLEN